MFRDLPLDQRISFLQQVAAYAANAAPVTPNPIFSGPQTSAPLQGEDAFAALLRLMLAQQTAQRFTPQPVPLLPIPSLPPHFLRRFGQNAAPANIDTLFPPMQNATASNPDALPVSDLPPLPDAQMPTGDVPVLPDTQTPWTDTVPTDLPPLPTSQTPTDPAAQLPTDTAPTAPIMPASTTSTAPVADATSPASYTFTPESYAAFNTGFADIAKANNGAAYTPASAWDKLHNFLLFLSGSLPMQWAADQSKTLSPEAAASFKAKALELISKYNLAVDPKDLDAAFPTADNSPATALKTLTTLLYFKAMGAPEANWGAMIGALPVTADPSAPAPTTPAPVSSLPEIPAVPVSAPQPPTPQTPAT